jgi:hypothetical protein
LDNRAYLLSQRGYSESQYEDRRETLNALLTESDSGHLTACIESLLADHRPIAIQFHSTTVPALLWLRDSQIGYELYLEENHILWFVPSQ